MGSLFLVGSHERERKSGEKCNKSEIRLQTADSHNLSILTKELGDSPGPFQGKTVDWEKKA